jgi:hypothetical protein
MKKEINNLGDLIKSKGFMKNYIMEEINKRGIQCNASTFSKWCTGKHKPQHLSAKRVIGEILGVSEETISNYI